MVEKNVTAHLTNATGARQNTSLVLKHPIEIVEVSITHSGNTVHQVFIYADNTIVEMDITEDKIVDHDKEKIAFLIHGDNHLVKRETLVATDTLRIAEMSSGNSTIAVDITYIDRPDLITLADNLNLEDIKQVGTDQMGDAVPGSEFYMVGDRLKVG